jgi:hypothetical protein
LRRPSLETVRSTPQPGTLQPRRAQARCSSAIDANARLDAHAQEPDPAPGSGAHERAGFGNVIRREKTIADL